MARPAPAGGRGEPEILRAEDGGAGSGGVRVHEPEGLRYMDSGRVPAPLCRSREKH